MQPSFLAEVLADAPDYRPPYHQPRYQRRQTGISAPAGDPGDRFAAEALAHFLPSC